MSTPRIRVYLGCSLDGAIAGPDHDLSFLHGHAATPGDALGFEDFLSQVGAMVMGRSTWEVVVGMGVWPYGDLPVLVATHRPLQPNISTVHAVEGSIAEVLDRARALAGDRDVYLDGGQLVRAALQAGLVDELCLTFVPVVVGQRAIRLFDGLEGPLALEFVDQRRMGAMLQLTARPVSTPAP